MSQDLAQQLSELKKLLDAGLITTDDYEHKKAELLSHRFTSGGSGATTDSGGLKTLGAYTLLEAIGAGGMGTVYRGRHRNDEKSRQQGGDVAIKVLHPQYARQPAYRDRFEQEALLGLRMDHPNIVRVFDLIVDGDLLGLVMELIEGRELSDIIGRTVGPMPWAQASPIFRQLLDVIACVHDSGIVHRDIKPENLMVTGERVKLMDFGIAKDISNSNTRTGTTMGTVAYMAPEQFLSTRDVDERADIYALGMTLYEMLAGQLPWDNGLAEFSILKLKESGDYPGPETFYPHIPQHVLDTLAAMLQVNIDARIPSIAAVRTALYPDTTAPTGYDGIRLPPTNIKNNPTPEHQPTPSPAKLSPKPGGGGGRQLLAATLAATLAASGLGVVALVVVCAGVFVTATPAPVAERPPSPSPAPVAGLPPRPRPTPSVTATPAPVAGQDVSAFSIRTGDCFQEVDGETVTELTVVPCTQSHDNEVFKTFDVSIRTYNEAAIEAESERTCLDVFQRYVGLDYDSSKFTVAWMTPTNGSWASGDREVLCILYDSVPMTGSARGSRQ
jgi:serine/threonine protein kinase